MSVGFVPAGTVSTVKLVSGNWILLQDYPKGWVRTSQARRYFTAGECFARREKYLPDFKEHCPPTDSLIEKKQTSETESQYFLKVCTGIPNGDSIQYLWQPKLQELPGKCYP